MSYRIDEVEGIGPAYKAKLAEAGIATTGDLLKECASSKGRQATSKQTEISTTLLLKWADMADLMRIPGIGRQFGELLKASGVDTVKELRTRKPDNLTPKLAEVNAEKNLAKAVPSLDQVTSWVEAAKETEPMITH